MESFFFSLADLLRELSLLLPREKWSIVDLFQIQVEAPLAYIFTALLAFRIHLFLFSEFIRSIHNNKPPSTPARYPLKSF
jgi:hypothetical protein